MQTIIIDPKNLDALLDLNIEKGIVIVYNDEEFFIHDKKTSKLKMLKGKSGDYNCITEENILNSINTTGTHTVALADNMDQALDAFNEWSNQ